MKSQAQSVRRATGIVASAAAGIGLAVALVAGGPAGAASGRHAAVQANGVSIVVPKQKVTITVSDWDNGTDLPAVIAAFHKKYPQVTVKHQFTDAANFQKTIKLVMQSSNPPDVVQYNTPVRDLGAAGLILNLTPYEKAYGWDKTVPVSLLDQTRFSADGITMGVGKLLAAPYTVPVVGVYYNKTLTAKAGISGIPTTFSVFEADLAKAKAAGIQPLVMGSLDFGGIHNWGAVLNSFSKASALRGWLYGKHGATITNAGSLAATSAFQGWAAKGYYPAAANSTSDVDAAASFAQGGSAFLIDGSWQAGNFQSKLGSQVGFFLLPMQKATDAPIANASVAAYSVSAKTKHPAAAVAFLNFFYSKQAAAGIHLLGNISLNPTANGGLTGAEKDVATAYARVAKGNGAMIFPDQAAPALLSVLTADIQEVVAQKKTPQAFLGDLQSTWSAYHKK
jgi:ABC-type glycerol-3-phosphate transport system substrate-binding protein